MKLQRRVYSTVCALLISTPAFAAQIPLPTTLDNLLPDGDFAVIGDKTFDQFTYTANGDMPIPEQIIVEATAGDTGIRFAGPFLDLPGGAGNGASSGVLGYTVTSTEGMSYVMLSGNPSLLGGSGSASVTETYDGFPTVKLDIFDDFPFDAVPTLVEARAELGTTVNSLTVTQGITLRTDDPNISATLQFTDQEFVPEPTGFVAALVGLIGFGLLRRHRRR